VKVTELLKEGTNKKVWATDDSEMVVMEFKDESLVLDSTKKVKAKDKGAINNAVSAHLFQYLENYYVPNHFVKVQSDKQMVCKKLEMLPFEVIVRNLAAGSFCKRYKLQEGKELATPVIEIFLKDEKLGNPMINEYHAFAFELASTDEMRTIIRTSTKINAILKSFFERRSLKLVDFKLEFGRHKEQILLGDELSLDSFRLWDVDTEGNVHPKKFDLTGSNPEAVYAELRSRILMQG
jgi:phosphoribosylaminoimidazole-succinocarboxamide synthase